MAVTVGELEARLHADVSSFISGMRKAENAFQQTSRSISQGSSNMSGLTASINGVQNAVGKLSSKMNMAFGAIGAGFILPQIFSAAKTAVIDFNQQVDQATVALTNFLGSGTAAKDMIVELQDFAAQTPFQFKDLLGTTQSMMAMGVAADDVLPRMQAIGDAAAAMGGSPEVLQRIQRALGQIQAKGRVQSEELLQLAEAGIPAYQYLADALGTTTGDLMDELRKGTVDSTTAVSALLDGMSRDFGGMMEEQSKTMMGAMSTVMDYVQMTVGAIFRPLFEALRDSFVAISEILSSDSMKKGASDFASSIASVIGSIQSLIGAFSKTLAKPFKDIMKAMGSLVTVGVRLAKALKPMITTVLVPLAAAVSLVANVLAPLVRGLASLAEFVTRNQVVVSALAALLMAKVVTGFMASGKAALFFGGAISKSMAMFGLSGKIAALEFQKLRMAGVGTFTAIKGAAQYASISVKGFGLALKAVMIKLLPMMIAFMVIGKLMQAFSDRNKDAKARTEELTGAIKEQTDVILAQENALSSLASKGLTTLNDALTATGEEGEKTTNALIQVGKSGSDYAKTMRDFKKDTEGASKALAVQNGFTAEQAEQMASYVKNYDKGSEASHRATMTAQGFTAEMIAQTLAMEQLDDSSENTDFAKMTKGIIDATIRSNEATQQFYNEAIAIAALAKEKNANMSADEEAILIYEEFIKRSAEYEQQQRKIALTQSKLGITTESATSRLTELINTMKDGKVEASDFLRALMGSGNYSATSAKEAYFNMGVALDSFGKSLKETGGNQNALQQAGYDFRNMLAENQATILGLGGTLGDVDAAMSDMIGTFIKQGVAAKYSEAEMKKLLISMGLLKDNGDLILTVDVRIEGLEKLRATALAIGDMQMFNAITTQLKELNDQKKRSLGLDLKALNLGGSGSKKQVKSLKELKDAIKDVYETGLDNAREKIRKAKEEQESYAKSVSDTIRSFSSLSSAYETVQSSSDSLYTSVVSAITSFGSFTDIIKEQTEATNALTQAKNAQSDAQGETNRLQAEQTRLLNKYKRASSREEQLDIQDELARNTEALAVAEAKLAEATRVATEAEEKQNKAGSSFVDGLKKRVQAAKDFSAQITKLRELGLGENALSQIISAGAETGGQMATELINGVANGLDSVNETNKLVSELDTVAKNVGNGIADSFYNAGVSGASATLAAMMTKADEATKFAEKIKTLVAMGLSEDNLQDVLSAGVGAGTKIADQLIAGGSEAIAKANQISDALKTAADSAGASAAGKFYSAGVTFAQAIFDGLKAQWESLKPQLDKMTSGQLQTVLDRTSVTVPAFVDQVQPSPSIMNPQPISNVPAAIAPVLGRDYWRKKFLEMVNKENKSSHGTVTAYIKAGATAKADAARQKRWDDYVIANNVPAMATGGIVNKATLALIGEAGPEAVIPLSKLGDMGSGTVIHINVNAGMGADGTQVGQKIVNELIAWQRRNGALPVKVQS